MKKISVVVPIFNRGDTLSKFLNLLVKQTLSSKHYGVMVTDNNSKDETRKVVAKFKQTYKTKENKIKGNCDAELILSATMDFYEKSLRTGILVSGDGDFSCLIDFWKNKGLVAKIVAPNRKFCSLFLKGKNISLTFLEDLITTFEKPLLETEL